jgi:hypothetical protein
MSRDIPELSNNTRAITVGQIHGHHAVKHHLGVIEAQGNIRNRNCNNWWLCSVCQSKHLYALTREDPLMQCGEHREILAGIQQASTRI